MKWCDKLSLPSPKYSSVTRLIVILGIASTISLCAEETSTGNVEDTKENTSHRKRPRFVERQQDRNSMVLHQIQQGSIPVKNGKVLAAMRSVPRHRFVPKALRVVAYADRPLPIGSGQTISQPFIVAYMTEALQLKPGDKVLEIGTGSGYQAAILSEITPHVYSIEIIKKLGQKSNALLGELGYNTIKLKIDDGYYGWKKHGPFDAIIVTCAAGHVPPPLIQQLAPGGRMVIPVGGTYDVQMLLKVTKNKGGKIRTHQLIPVRFVPMTGKSQEE